ncbi:Gfo/Idh/MocA family protein [Brevibacillus fulvus]|uniref:Dehydrogenase n=1 Tax=Brevibacillus fulvus TaxID=1125967 RepID=A0A938Y155_9BACL|nr:Gfo/Idh/MocA family oxidoreductase [Brevibacillus fulvus]MBM7589677.1 putative dehydrogenase [Brevibacillus fulvus]
MSEKIRVGVIGCGKIAQWRHIPEYQENPLAELVAVSDIDLARAQSIAAAWQIPRAYADYRQILDSPDIDAVSICTPNATHAEIGLLALQAGKHVLLEKPMAIRLEDCLALAEEAERQQTILLVGHNQRFIPVYRRAKELLEEGSLGKICQFTSHFHHGGPEGWSIDGEQTWFTDKTKAGFGVIADLGVHKLDLIRWLLADEFSQLTAFAETFQRKRVVEDSAVMLGKTAGGIVGTFSFSWNNPLQDHRMVLFGEHGNLTTGETMFGIKVEYHDGRVLEEEQYPLRRQDGHFSSGVIEHFIACIKNGDRPLIDGCEAVRTMRTIFRALPW